MHCCIPVTEVLNSSDVSAWTCTWPWPVLKHQIQVLGLVLDLVTRYMVVVLGLEHLNLADIPLTQGFMHPVRLH